MTTTRNGWPVLDASQVKSWRVPVGKGNPRTIPLRRGAPGFILTHLISRFDEIIEDVNAGQLDDWGYARRYVGGTRVWSEHAGGVAVDINATKHPQGIRHSFTDEQERRVRRMLRYRYLGRVRWGIDFPNPDPMHFELKCTLMQARALAAILRVTKRGRRIKALNR